MKSNAHLVRNDGPQGQAPLPNHIVDANEMVPAGKLVARHRRACFAFATCELKDHDSAAKELLAATEALQAALCGRIQSHGRDAVTDGSVPSENAEGTPAVNERNDQETSSPAQPEGGAAVAASSSSSPVAWMHDGETRLDICHDTIKKLLIAAKCGRQVEHYTIPLYAHPAAVQADAAKWRNIRNCMHIEKLRDVVQLYVDTIHSVEGRCMAADGPVTPTHQEITDDELRKVYEAAVAILKETE